MKLNRFFRPRSKRAAQKILHSASLSRPPVMEPLEDRQMLSLTIDLRVAGGGKTASVTSVGQVIHLEAWATVSGSTSGANDGLQSVCGSFLSSEGSTVNCVAGNLGNQNVTADYVANGASLGTQQDLNGDGNKDVGSNNNADIAGFFNARAGGIVQDGTVSGNTQAFEFGTIDYTVTNLHFGSATNVNFRLRNGIPSGAFDAVWLQDNAGQNDQIGSVIIGSPVVISDPNLSPPSAVVSGTISKSVNGATSAFAGVTVDLDNSSNTTLLGSTTTAADGSYSFQGLSAGTYALKEIVPSGYSQTSPSSSPTLISLSSNTATATQNFVDTAVVVSNTASIAGTVSKVVSGVTSVQSGVTVYLDNNGDGSLDAGDTSTTTSASGTFSFSSLAAGTYHLREVVPSGFNQTSPVTLPTDITLTAGQKSTGDNFTNTAVVVANTGSISGTVSKVVSGVTSADAGITVYLDNNNDGVLDSGDASTTTSATGTYGFSNLAANTYHLREVVPSGFTQTSPGSSPTNVSVGTGAVTGQNFTLTASNTTISGLLTGAIIGTPGSYKNDGNTIAKAFDGNLSTFYDAAGGTGNWAGLNLGSQFTITKVSYAPRSGYASRMVGGIFQGSNTADFSSGVVNLATITATPATGTFTSITINNSNKFEFVRYLSPPPSNGNVAELQFYGTNGTVVVGTASIAGTVSKVVSGATSGFSGVTVYLDNNNDGILDSGDTSTITSSTGSYSFTNLVAGPYHVREVVPSGYSQTSPSSSPTNITLATGQASTGDNFTDTATVTTGAITLSGNVFRDLNSNKVKDSNETGLSGWVVYIDLNHDGQFESNENNKTTDANGNFTFVSLKAGTYQVRVIQKSGFTLTTPTTGFYTVTLNPGVPVSVTFGEH